MTPARQPQQQRYVCNCCEGHPCETVTDQGVPNCGCLHNPDIGALWIKATHTSPPAPEEMPKKDIEMWIKTEIFKNLLQMPELWKEHDTQVAKAEREKIIQMLIKFKESQGKHDGYASVVLDPIIESLQAQQEQP